MTRLYKEKFLFAMLFLAFIYSIVECYYTGDWYLLLVSFVIATIHGTFGQAIGMHMLFTHRSYRTKRWKEILLALWSVLLGFGIGPIGFAALHRQHHQHCDTNLDPHSPKTRGLWYIVTSWFMFKPLVPREQIKLPKDLWRDSVLRKIEENYYWIWIGLSLIFYAIGGFHFLLWFLLMPAAWNCLSTNCIINGLLHYRHLPGSYRNFDTKDDSMNNSVVHWITAGVAGYHNNHHHAPNKYNTAMKPGEFDLGGWIIKRFFAE